MYNGIKNPASGLRLDSDYTIYNIDGGFRALVFAIFIFEIYIISTAISVLFPIQYFLGKFFIKVKTHSFTFIRKFLCR